MSGHNKWAQIKHKKAIADSKKGLMFSKFAKAITAAARGNADPAKNVRLRTEIDRARAANMPSENIERALQRAQQSAEASEEVQLEILGPENIGIIVRTVTDSPNRTIAEARQLAEHFQFRVVGQGAVAWMFRRQTGSDGNTLVPTTSIVLSDEKHLQLLKEFLVALEELGDVQEIITNVQE
jgi:transcriptional/translational regulatory protein YebC/TACO1